MDSFKDDFGEKNIYMENGSELKHSFSSTVSREPSKKQITAITIAKDYV